MTRLWLLVFVLGCGGDTVHHLPDGPPIAIDAAPDAPAPAPAVFGRETTSAGGHLSSASFVVDVQVGHAIAQTPTASTSFTVQGNAPVKP